MIPNPTTRPLPDPNYRRPFGSDWLSNNMGTLPNHEWVAADDGGLVAHDATLPGLDAKIRDRHKRLEDVVIAFVEHGNI